MQYNQTIEGGPDGCVDVTLIVKDVVGNITTRVQQKYSRIKPGTIPDHVSYSKIEKYLRSVDIDITRRMFASYLKAELLPEGQDVRNSNFSLYTHEQIIYFILIDMFKPLLPLSKVKVLFRDILRPMIELIGLDATYSKLCENIASMAGCIEQSVTMAIVEDIQTSKGCESQPNDPADAMDQATGDVAYYTHIAALCMARGALDYYKLAPDTLLP